MYSFYSCIIYQCAGFTILQCTFQFYAQFYSHDDNKSPEIIHFLSNISRTLKKQVMVIPEKIQFCQKMMILLMGMTNLTWRNRHLLQHRHWQWQWRRHLTPRLRPTLRKTRRKRRMRQSLLIWRQGGDFKRRRILWCNVFSPNYSHMKHDSPISTFNAGER